MIDYDSSACLLVCCTSESAESPEPSAITFSLLGLLSGYCIEIGRALPYNDIYCLCAEVYLSSTISRSFLSHNFLCLRCSLFSFMFSSLERKGPPISFLSSDRVFIRSTWAWSPAKESSYVFYNLAALLRCRRKRRFSRFFSASSADFYAWAFSWVSNLSASSRFF